MSVQNSPKRVRNGQSVINSGEVSAKEGSATRINRGSRINGNLNNSGSMSVDETGHFTKLVDLHMNNKASKEKNVEPSQDAHEKNEEYIKLNHQTMSVSELWGKGYRFDLMEARKKIGETRAAIKAASKQQESIDSPTMFDRIKIPSALPPINMKLRDGSTFSIKKMNISQEGGSGGEKQISIPTEVSHFAEGSESIEDRRFASALEQNLNLLLRENFKIPQEEKTEYSQEDELSKDKSEVSVFRSKKKLLQIEKEQKALEYFNKIRYGNSSTGSIDNTKDPNFRDRIRRMSKKLVFVDNDRRPHHNNSSSYISSQSKITRKGRVHEVRERLFPRENAILEQVVSSCSSLLGQRKVPLFKIPSKARQSWVTKDILERIHKTVEFNIECKQNGRFVV